jgi:hypothetical protein
LPLLLAAAILRIVLRAAYSQAAHGNEEEKLKENKKETCRRVVASAIYCSWPKNQQRSDRDRALESLR